MKICIIVDTFPRLSETFVLNQALTLMARGHDVEVLCREATDIPTGTSSHAKRLRRKTRQWWGRLAFLRGPVERMPPRLRHKVKTVLDISDVAHLRRFDVLLAHFGYEGMRVSAVLGKVERMPPLVTIFHGHDVATVDKDESMAIYHTLFRQGALHLAVNDTFRQVLVDAGAPDGRTRVHHMGIALDKFPFTARDWTSRPVRLLSVGRLTEKKGVEISLRALAHARRLCPDVQWDYRIIGNGELGDSLETLADSLGLMDIVTFLGAQPNDEVQRCLAESHLFLQPSLTAENGDAEGIPVVLMEAMASGAIVISSYHSGIPELIADGETGFLAEEGSDEQLADQLVKAVRYGSELDSVARAARHHVETSFNIEIQVAELENALRGLLPVGGKPSRAVARQAASS